MPASDIQCRVWVVVMKGAQCSSRIAIFGGKCAAPVPRAVALGTAANIAFTW